MTAVAFHSGVADKLGYSCRLLRKAWRAGSRVLVVGSVEQLARLDALLWQFEPGEFIPHVRLRAGQTVTPLLARTPIWLVDEPAEFIAGPFSATAAAPDVLVNLGPGMAADVEQFARVIEVVADTPDEIGSGRQRWRAHVAAGLSPSNLSQAAQPPKHTA